jgi:hypothetical protein
MEKLAPLLPAAGGLGKPRLNHRLIVAAFYYAEARGVPLWNACRLAMATRAIAAHSAAALGG